MKKPTKAQLDKQILDHADEIIRLMTLKGMKDESDCDQIHIWMLDDNIEVENTCQEIGTRTRKKK